MKEENPVPTQITLHAISNILGDQSQRSLFSDHREIVSQNYRDKITGKLERFGVDLTETQSRIMEGILQGFSQTSYEGNMAGENKDEMLCKLDDGRLYKDHVYVPKLRASQAQILRWAGVNKNCISSISRALDALQELGKKVYCFCYDRVAVDEKGNIIKDKSGLRKIESVVSVDNLFVIKEVRDQESGLLKYYEISPSILFLDQRESYFMLIPYNWRQEVKELYGTRKASNYTFLFLLFLRYQFEQMKRKEINPPYVLKWDPEEIAVAINMPESVYKKNRKRANQILEDAYEVASKVGYLKSYKRLGFLDILELNEGKYIHETDRLISNN